MASVEEALISVRQAFGPSGGGDHVDKNGNVSGNGVPEIPIVVPPTPPPLRKVEVKTESSLASVNITVPRPSPRVGKRPMPQIPPPPPPPQFTAAAATTTTTTVPISPKINTEEVSYCLKLKPDLPPKSPKFIQKVQGRRQSVEDHIIEAEKINSRLLEKGKSEGENVVEQVIAKEKEKAAPANHCSSETAAAETLEELIAEEVNDDEVEDENGVEAAATEDDDPSVTESIPSSSCANCQHYNSLSSLTQQVALGLLTAFAGALLAIILFYWRKV